MLNLTYRQSEIQAKRQPNSTGSYFRRAYFNSINLYFFLNQTVPHKIICCHTGPESEAVIPISEMEKLTSAGSLSRNLPDTQPPAPWSSHKELPPSAKCSLRVPRGGGSESLKIGPAPSQKDIWINRHWGDMTSRLT